MNRFENIQRVYYQGPPAQEHHRHPEHQMQQVSNFGRYQQEGRVQYVSDHSPSSRPATSSFCSPTNRQTEVRYVTIDSQLEPQGHQVYTNPFNEIQPHHSAILENQGIKRVTSYTHFSGYPGSHVQSNVGSRIPMQMNPQVSQ